MNWEELQGKKLPVIKNYWLIASLCEKFKLPYKNFCLIFYTKTVYNFAYLAVDGL